MTKKKPSASLRGKRPINKSAEVKKKTYMTNPSHIANKMKRSEMMGKYLAQKKKAKIAQRKLREETLGEDVQKPVPKTLDNTREFEPTVVADDDPEVAADEADDEFGPYFSDEIRPKILITTRPRPSQQLFYFIADLQQLVPGLEFYPRQQFTVKEIVQFATNRHFTHLIILSEKAKRCNGMAISHLHPHEETGMAGPTAYFKVSSIVTGEKIPQRGRATSHIPELNLHGFGTRLGHRIGRLLGSLFPHAAEFEGRQVVTFHNQRDYLFVRHHRYIFNEKKKKPEESGKAKKKDSNKPEEPPVKARLQELGPRFTLKLRWLQEGIFDTMHGEYEWFHKRKEMDTSRRKFHL